jgi:hypothetical protein
MGTTFERDGRGAAVDPEVQSEEFEAYYREHQPSLLRYAMSRNAVDPEGVVHLALLDGFGALDRMRSREPRSIRAYLFRAVTSHIAMEHRRLGSEQFGSHELPQWCFWYCSERLRSFGAGPPRSVPWSSPLSSLRPRSRRSRLPISSEIRKAWQRTSKRCRLTPIGV